MSCNRCNRQNTTSDGWLAPRESFTTITIHTDQNPEKWDSRCVVAPLYTATTYKQKAPAEPYQFEYSRTGNPTRNTLESVLAAMDKAKHAFCYATGIGAVSAVATLVGRGDHIVCCDDVYGGTSQLFRLILSRMGISTKFVDLCIPENLEKVIKPNTKMIWVESPTNPSMKIIDIAEIARIKNRHPGIIFVVDNTFLTPYLQSPLALGADVVVYSITKYMNGHSDIIMGSAATNNDELAKRLRFIQNAMGCVPSPIDCYFVLRSLKTLPLRIVQEGKHSLVIAKWLKNNCFVKRVLHPALPDHPGHDVAKKQSCGHSSCFSFEHKGGERESKILLSSLKIFSLAVSLGGYESMAQLPALMTHKSLPEKIRQELGITDALIRLSIGLELPEVLIADLDQGFKAAFDGGCCR